MVNTNALQFFCHVLTMNLSEGWGFDSSSGRDIFCLKYFDTFTRTSVRVSKMNAVARTQLTLQMLTLLKNVYNARASFKKHGAADVWPW